MLIHLDRHRVNLSIFAPDRDQVDVINHMNGSTMNEKRNVLIESARIARGNVHSLDDLNASQFDALFIPGGFGVAKNLSNFASQNASCTLLAKLEDIVKKFHSDGKPMGFCCIAPIIAARCIPGVEITLGKESEQKSDSAHQAVIKMGANHIACDTTDIHVDSKAKVVTTPAYMSSKATIFEVYTGIGKMVDAVLSM
ncbi:unnamed protein product [Trichobilharzia szidati]|nr:unnamed protein product [Trichobilharzia szidati]